MTRRTCAKDPATRKRGNVPFSGSASTISSLIDNGEEPRRVFDAIVKCAARSPGVHSAALYFPSMLDPAQQELVAAAGPAVPALQDEPEIHGSAPNTSVFQVDIICLGAPIGCLAVGLSGALSKKTDTRLRTLAHHASVVFEKQKLGSTLQHFLDRLEVLNELNQLIASNISLPRLVKSLARDATFRFGADVALTFLLEPEQHRLVVQGGYGCTTHLLPQHLPLDSGLLGSVMRIGGRVSAWSLAKDPQGLEFLPKIGVNAVEVCCLEVRGDSLGVILLGFRRETALPSNEFLAFEEFAQGAAVAIANARTQERINAYAERLEELVGQRTADLAVQTARAEEANKAKSRFLANVSHELRTPLTAIVGYSSVLADGVFGTLNDKQRDALAAIVRSSDHLKRLIDDVLNLARIESGKEEAKPQRVPVRDLLQQTHRLMLQQAIHKNVTLLPLRISDSVFEAHLYVDAKHAHQIVINLMSNAVKYTPSGGKVWVEAAILGDHVKLSVFDTGVGIPPDRAEKLFERFERGDDTYSRSQEGTGIGLNLTRHLVELNNGRIGVESELGKGSVFWVLLPLAPAEEPRTLAPEQAEAEARLDGLSILVVDDNHDTCTVLKHILSAAGAEAHAVHSVKDGLTVLKGQKPPDILLTDLAIPNESGLELIEYVRKSKGSLGRLPILVLSACAFQRDRDAALQAGASGFMPKPFRPAEIVRALKRIAAGDRGQAARAETREKV